MLLGLMVRNYIGVGFTRPGKILIGASSVFLMGSILMAITYYGWMMMGIGPSALPVLAIMIMNLIGITMLYLTSRL
jgi:hypothetical protein